MQVALMDTCIIPAGKPLSCPCRCRFPWPAGGGRPVDATNIVGLILLLAYTHGVRIFLPALSSSDCRRDNAGGAGFCRRRGYPGAGLAARRRRVLDERGPDPGYCLVIFRLFAVGEEAGHRTSLPVWGKAPIIVVIVFLPGLQQTVPARFCDVFSHGGAVGAYERATVWAPSAARCPSWWPGCCR